MEFGFMALPRALDETVEAATLGEQLGFRWLGVADSPTVYQESYLHQLAAARATERISIGPMVTHVVARHPVIVANLLATLNEFTDGRVVAAVGTGNSAARGLRLRPASLADLREGIEAVRSYWRGEGGAFRESEIPITGLVRRGCPILVAADAPKLTELAGEVGDGLLYGGTLETDVLERRIASARRVDSGRRVWVAPSASVRGRREEVKAELGAMIIAMANRAIRGDLDERGIPPELQADVRDMWRQYDYAFHADTTRPRNLELVSEHLADYLTDTTCIWGDEARWAERLDTLERLGCDGVHFIIGQPDQRQAVREIGARLASIGRL
jgi:5,10-methylenetetrahydromethanopterin reductase